MTQSEPRPTFVVREASKAFGANPVLRNLSFTANPGEITIMLGANGSGKSTLLRICAGLLRADKGAVTFPSCSPGSLPSIGYIGHQSLVYGAMTVRENVDLFSQLVGQHETEDLLRRWDLMRFEATLARELSRGTMLRLGLCRAFLGNPSCLLLDEPTGALDERALEIFRTEVLALLQRSPTTSVVIATHDVSRLLSLATRIVVISEGAIALDSNALGNNTQDRVVDYYRGLNR